LTDGIFISKDGLPYVEAIGDHFTKERYINNRQKTEDYFRKFLQNMGDYSHP
jgi:hypothetical protein